MRYLESGTERFRSIGIHSACDASTLSLVVKESQLLRIFSTFPDGWPGAGLLLLRGTVGSALVAQGLVYFAGWHELRFLSLAVASLTVTTGAFLLAGYLTPLVGIAGALLIGGTALSWFPSPNPDLFEAKTAAALVALISIALVCLGPGAFSLDARLFGRREIIIPDTASSPKF
jgi:putative oxidoreductase